ncbi:MurR/RpiR family transcriptional regulator [Rhodoferax lacus]|uniref:MurR/RpiR family transcriptional regulator n=1 Tax=Rhodoferax lacus TaxID=2184758 RepID=A0A3E1RED2_9BURK|nr:MurR/RpiR family transcriptional regulator [Rhodoferax lacus]RFO97726.1 MurR/RpiR family transcriptional regulator [Rhodoferax lacus]
MKTAKPSTLEGLRALIGQQSEQLTPRMRDAANYAMEHPNDIALNPVASVARQSAIAPAAFIRLAKALGFEGYSDLQRLFRAPLQQAAKPTHSERIRHFGGELSLDDPQNPVAVLQAFSQANIVSLQHLQADAAALPLQKAIALIQGARLVHVIGLRRSYALAAYLAYALNRVKQPAVQITAQGGSVAEQAAVANAQDVLVAISFPPYAPDTLTVCAQAKAQGAKLLVITNGVLSPLAKNADLVLEVNDAELKGFRSLTSAFCLVQTLAMGIAFGKRKPRGKAGAAARAEAEALDLGSIDC